MKNTPQTKPKNTSVIFKNLPEELKQYPQFVFWKYIYSPNPDIKPKKPPLDCAGNYASINNPTTWSSFKLIQKNYPVLKEAGHIDGIGLVLCPDNPFTAIDLDNCAKNGRINSRATKILKLFNSYSEISPSEKGLRILIKGKLESVDGSKKGNLEVYSSKRFVTLTGRKLKHYPAGIQERQKKLDQFYKEYFPVSQKPLKEIDNKSRTSALTGQEVIELASKSKNSQKFIDLFRRGDWQKYTFPSQSEADYSLLQSLSFWTNKDPDQTEALFLQSKLYRPEKGDAYLKRTIQKVIMR
jgi:primase-polymerase (primpol)-like protein